MSDVISRDYFNVFIKSRCNCDRKLCDGNHMLSYIPNINNVIYLEHNSRYILGVTNNYCNPVLAVCTIDGLKFGKFRLASYSTCLIKRPISTNRQLVFVERCKQLSSIATLKHLKSRSPGKIQVTILPGVEKDKEYDIVNYQKLKPDSNLSNPKNEFDSKSSAMAELYGGTTLGAKSTQMFRMAPYLETVGKHLLCIQLLSGDPTKNTVICDEYSPIVKTSYNPDQIYEVVNYEI